MVRARCPQVQGHVLSHHQAELWTALALVGFGLGLILIGGVGIGALLIDLVKSFRRKP